MSTSCEPIDGTASASRTAARAAATSRRATERNSSTAVSASADPVAPPRIDPAYLAEPDDLRAHVEGLRLAHAILADEAFRGLVAERLVPSGTSDEAIEADVRRRATTVFHPVATCAMGAGEDSVVDPRLRVRGVDGLRVVDASVLPRMPGANTLAPTIVVAERGADLILRR